jgi:hypothetical protein
MAAYGEIPMAAVSRRPLRTISERRATSCSHARFLRNAIVKEAATASPFEARSGSIRTRDPVVS